LKRAILRESTFCAGLYRAMMDSASAWETREEINIAVRAVGLKEPSSFQLGSGLIDHSQNMTAAAMQIAEK
jgi:hypothetical protein